MCEEDRDGHVLPKISKFSNGRSDETFIGNTDYVSRDDKTEAGSYFLGTVIKKYASAPFTQCLARKKNSGDCYLMKILVLEDSDTSDKCSLARRSIFHNEYSILSLLKNYSGVIQVHDLFKEYIMKDDQTSNATIKRVCMVLECLIPHGHHNSELSPLNEYVQEGKLSETEALHIFYNLLIVLEELHKRNIYHRDLKLSNVIVNRKTLKVKIIDFYYARFMAANGSKYKQSKTFCFSTPDGLFEDGIFPNTCDIWSAGVILFEMLNGWMSFAGSSSYRLSVPSNRAVCNFYLGVMENDCVISDGTKELLRRILNTIPQNRLQAGEVVDMVSTLLATQSTSQDASLFVESLSFDQIVPECPEFDCKDGQESELKLDSKSSFIVPEVPNQSEIDGKTQAEKKNEIMKTAETSGLSTIQTEQEELMNNKQIKVAMLRLGATSINCINALSFSYSKKKSSQS